jgi:trehalose 6-phosphate synthase/phosphatase
MTKSIPRRLIIVSNRLPFHIVKKNGKLELKQSDGGLVSALQSYLDAAAGELVSEVVWVGSAEFTEKTWNRFNKKKLAGLKYSVDPIFFDKRIYNKFYYGFCNSTLWPLFHYFPSFVEFDNETFICYEQVNKEFADKIISISTSSDVIWIHDYQLLMVPALIREANPHATIGFFLHIPFPSFEIFRMLHRPWKDKLIAGMLGADLIGFHTHEYVQHFLKTVQMVKGYDHKFRLIMLQHRQVKAEMFPLGIDFTKFNTAIDHNDVIELKKGILKSLQSRKIIFSVDRLDYTKGINHRLSGFEHFLEHHSEWREKVVFVLVVVPSRQIVSKYNERKKMIEEEIGRINGKYSTLHWQPIIYRYTNLGFHELVAIYNVSDVGLITPLRDGMNLVAKEYLACRTGNGVLILSELAGAANELSEALLVNPMDKADVSDAIYQGLTMPLQNQADKIRVLQKRLKDYTVTDWMNDFLKQLAEIKEQQLLQETKVLNDISLTGMIEHYHKAHRRLFLLDYDGTLVPFSKLPQLAVPDENVIKLLELVAADPRNDIAIISGRDSVSLTNWFGTLPVTLVAEHGAGIRAKHQPWEFFLDSDSEWRTLVRPVLESFCQRSPGSFVEVKKYTLAWHYRNVDSELGFIRSRELLDNLHHLIRNSPLQVIDGNKVIEVRPSGINKGAVAKLLLQNENYDFVLALGDDKTDEDMFRDLADQAYTVKIGVGHTVAKYNLATQVDVISLLSEFIDETLLCES